jgi:GAF domain-containing protein
LEALIAAIREFTRTIVNPYDPDDLLGRVTTHATAVLDAAGAGIMLTGHDGDLGFAAACSEAVQEAERRQMELRSGACFEAYGSGEVVAIEDLHSSQRWPTYSAAVASLGLASVLGVPMSAHGQTIGVLNVYRDRTGPWSDDDVEAAQILAGMGAGYLLHVQQLTASQQLAEQLQRTLESRALIERAKGMLMARYELDADEAFEWLQRSSKDTDRTLRDVAVAVLRQHVSA